MPQAPHFLTLLAATLASALPLTGEEAPSIAVPSATAYSLPDVDAIRSRRGERDTATWSGSENRVIWFGNLKKAGTVDAFVELLVPQDTARAFRLGIDGAFVDGVSAAGGAEGKPGWRFAGLKIPEPGYRRIELESTIEIDGEIGRVGALSLTGDAVEGAHFNLEPRRNAASVHLFYPTPEDAKIALFHAEATAVDDPVHTFYMACGFHRGYFGMQVNSATERRIIFSVWDSGNEAIDRSKVADDDLVQLVAKGEDVHASGFGNEGTGGHSHLKYLWKTGEPQRFTVTARPVDATHTVYSGFYFHPERQEWMLIAAFKAPKDGGYLRGLHSFSENFWGSTGHLRRKARFGHQWVRDAAGDWTELTTARFSHDPTGKANRLDRFMGVEDGRFFLSHGGFVPGSTEYGEEFHRPATSGPPAVDLPAVE